MGSACLGLQVRPLQHLVKQAAGSMGLSVPASSASLHLLQPASLALLLPAAPSMLQTRKVQVSSVMGKFGKYQVRQEVWAEGGPANERRCSAAVDTAVSFTVRGKPRGCIGPTPKVGEVQVIKCHS